MNQKRPSYPIAGPSLKEPVTGANPFRRAKNLACPEMLFHAIDNPDPSVRSAAVRGLGLVCLLDPDISSNTTANVLRYFEFLAESSPCEALRIACIDAIYTCRDLQRLKRLFIESMSSGARRYRDRAVESLSLELELKC
ncbi:MAG: hypothetical protein U0R44_00205 [Candidatus Micrarchaeia archaeon]